MSQQEYVKPLEKMDLIRYFEDGCKARQAFRIGVEHEQFVFKPTSAEHEQFTFKQASAENSTTQQDQAPFRRVSYDETNGIRALLDFFTTFGYTYIYEAGNPIGLFHPNTKASISLEPGGQFELAGAPHATVEDVYTEQKTHFDQLKQAEKALGLSFLPCGFDPYSKREDVPWMPKARYAIMKAHMPTVGTMGLDMMTRTCTAQLNLDYASEADMVKKMRVSMALQPLVAACFANSTQVEGSASTYKAYRTKVWHHTDAARSGILQCVFEDTFSFESYVDYLLSIPMYFVKRKGVYHNVAGVAFSDFMKGNLSSLPGEQANLADFEDQISIAFPEVRLKRYIELRGADSGQLSHIMDLTHFWVNLFYTETRLDNAYELVKSWTFEEVNDLYHRIPLEGKNAFFKGKTVEAWLKLI